jgi:phospholipase/lecithinase/hemolysin
LGGLIIKKTVLPNECLFDFTRRDKMSAKVKRIILVWFLCITLVLSTAVIGYAYSGILSFGDSLSDNGYYQGYYGGTAGNTNPADIYGIMRFSDGPVWLEYMAQSYGVPLLDMAYGGATTSYDNPAVGLTITGLQWQVDAYKTFVSASIPSGTLVTVWAGANDFLQGRPFVTAAANVTSAIQELADAGGQNFLVPFLPDIGLTPAFLGTPLQGTATGWSQAFNTSLWLDLLALESINPEINCYVLDTFTLLRDVIANPSSYGFTNVTSDGGGNPPEGYLFWDGIHPTTDGHLLIANYGWKAVPEPSTIVLLVLGMMGLAGIRRKFQK